MSNVANERTIIRYLLRDLGEAEAEQLEKNYFEDAQLLEEISAVEDELIQSYVSGALPPIDRAKFEQAYLGDPKKRKRVEFARTFRDVVERDRPANATTVQPRTGWLNSFLEVFSGWKYQVAVPALATLLAAAGLWIAYRAAENDPTQLASNVAVFDLQIGRKKALGEDFVPERVQIPQTADRILLRMDMSGRDFPEYRVTILRADGAEIYNTVGTVRDSLLRISVPVQLLPPGQYDVVVRGVSGGNGVTDAGEIRVEVVRQ